MYKYIYTYQTLNKINGKTYIGYHRTNNINDGYIGCGVRSQSYANSAVKKTNSAFIKAVVKYGYENFKIEILSFFDTTEEAVNEERFLVNDEWVKRSDTYNISIGGNGGVYSNIYKYKDEIINDFKNGMFTTHIAKKYKVNHSNLHLILKDEKRNVAPSRPLPYLLKYKEVIPEIINKRKTIPGYSLSKIQSEYGMDFKTAKKICNGLDIVKPIKLKVDKNIKSKYYGTVVYIENKEVKIDVSIAEFCKINNIKESNFRMMLNGRVLSANGFSLKPTPKIKFQELVKDGNIIEMKPNMKIFCKNNCIPYSSIFALRKGLIKQTKGYTLNNAR